MGATSGGWPLHVMLTPELKPFFCTHYVPKKAFFTLTREMSDMWWSEGRTALLQLADSTSAQLLTVMEPSEVKVGVRVKVRVRVEPSEVKVNLEPT